LKKRIFDILNDLVGCHKNKYVNLLSVIEAIFQLQFLSASPPSLLDEREKEEEESG